MSIRASTWCKLNDLFWAFVKGGAMLVVWLTAGTAQVITSMTPDGTLGTEIMQNGHVYEISGGARPENGSNLFHSFDRFNLGTGDTAHFLGPQGVDNIIGRVTGGAASMIDGRLQADATLFLLNPHGMMFGPNATLNINGSFHASTADVLRFEDGSEFAVYLSGQSSLSVAAPSAFGFVNATPAAIAIQGSTLEVSEGKTLSIVGGDIDIAGGNLRASSGQINLVSAASVGDVTFDGVRPDTGALTALGSITITGSQLEASGQVSGRMAGQIVIRGDQLTIAQSRMRVTNRSEQGGGGVDIEVDHAIILSGTDILSDTLDAGQGGHIVLRGASLTLDEAARIRSETFGAGSGGDITLAVESLELTENAAISSNSLFSTGAAGYIMIHGRGGHGTAAQSVTLRSSTLSTQVAGQGDEGTIAIVAEVLNLDHANLTAATTGAGDAGDIILHVGHLNATQQTTISSSSTAQGAAGTITIRGLQADREAQTVTLNNSTLQTNATGQGAGGTITITAEAVKLDNAILSATVNDQTSGGATSHTADIILTTRTLLIVGGRMLAETTGARRAGNITLNVGHLTASQQAVISSSSQATGAAGSVTIRGHQGVGSIAQTVTFDNASVRSDTRSPEQGGDISVQTETLSLTNDAELRSNTFGAGTGGGIAVQAGTLTLTHRAFIRSDTFGTGSGGDITLAVEILELTENATMSSNSPFSTGAAGDITVHGRGGRGTAARLVTLNHSKLSTETAGGAGGTITLTADAVELTHANLTAATTGSGQAGAITLNVAHLNATDQTLITTSSTEKATGDAGRVTIQGLGGAGTAASTVAFSNSAVRTQAESEHADGGAIRVQAQRIQLRDESTIRSDTARGQRGGNIDLDAELVVLENSDIIANSEAAQEKADIKIAGAFINDPRSVVQASGGVSILGSIFDSSRAVQLPLDFLHQAALLQQRCAPGSRGSQASSFALVGRDGPPLEPGYLLLSNLPIGEDVPAPEGQRPQTQTGDLQAPLPVAWTFDCDK